jgi:hypothetical protein
VSLANDIAKREMDKLKRCDLCGKPTDGQITNCRAGVDWDNGAMHACDGSAIEMPDGTGAEVVREALRAPLLRAALDEALDAWERSEIEVIRSTNSQMVAEIEIPISVDLARIAELRAKFLEGK